MTVTMKANRIHRFGGPEVILFEDVPRPRPGTREVLVRVHAAGVGPWDAWVRAGRSVLPQPLPLTLGADLAGTVEAIGFRDALLPWATKCWVYQLPFYRCVRELCSPSLTCWRTSPAAGTSSSLPRCRWWR